MKTFNPADFAPKLSALQSKLSSCPRSSSGRRLFTPELRASVVHLCDSVTSFGGGQSWFCKSVGVSESLVWKWRRQFATPPALVTKKPAAVSFRAVAVTSDNAAAAAPTVKSPNFNLRVAMVSGASVEEAATLLRGFIR